MSAGIRFVLFYLRQDPVKLSGCDLATAELTNASGVNLQGRATIRTIQIGLRGSGFASPISDKCPVFAPPTQVCSRAGYHASIAVDRVIKTFSPDSQCNRVVKSVFLDLHRLQRRNLWLIDDVSEALALVCVNPVLMHLENIVSLVRASFLPIQV